MFINMMAGMKINTRMGTKFEMSHNRNLLGYARVLSKEFLANNHFP